jgi:hypothetical protein
MVSRAIAISSSSAVKRAWSCRISSRLPLECWLPVNASIVESPSGSGSTFSATIFVGRWHRADHSIIASSATRIQPLEISNTPQKDSSAMAMELLARTVPPVGSCPGVR